MAFAEQDQLKLKLLDIVAQNYTQLYSPPAVL